MDDSEYLPSEEELSTFPRERERSVTPFLLRSQGRSEGHGLLFNSRISPSPSRSVHRRRRRRQMLNESSNLGSDSEDAATPARHHRPLLAPPPPVSVPSEQRLGDELDLNRRNLFAGKDSADGPYDKLTKQSVAVARTVATRTVRTEEGGGEGVLREERRRMHREEVVTTSSMKEQAVFMRTSQQEAVFRTPEQNKFSEMEWSRVLEGSPRLRFWEGMNWRRSPRTGYTYVNSLTYRDNVTPGREIPMPHMARWPIYLSGETMQVEESTTRFYEHRRFAAQTFEAEFSEDESYSEQKGVHPWLSAEQQAARNWSPAEQPEYLSNATSTISSSLWSVVRAATVVSSQVLSCLRRLISVLLFLMLLPLTSGQQLATLLWSKTVNIFHNSNKSDAPDLASDAGSSHQSRATRTLSSWLHSVQSFHDKEAVHSEDMVQRTEDRWRLLNRLSWVWALLSRWTSIRHQNRVADCRQQQKLQHPQPPLQHLAVKDVTHPAAQKLQRVNSWDRGWLTFLQERLPEVLLASLPANYALAEPPKLRAGSSLNAESQMIAENVANESIEKSGRTFWSRLSALVVLLAGVLIYPPLSIAQFVANTRAELWDWLYPQPEPVLRRSRRLRGMPPDMVEELRRQRRRRLVKRPVLSQPTTANGGPDTIEISDSEDEGLEESQVMTATQHKRHNVSLFSLLSALVGLFYRKKLQEQQQQQVQLQEQGDLEPAASSTPGLVIRAAGQREFILLSWWNRWRASRRQQAATMQEEARLFQKLGCADNEIIWTAGQMPDGPVADARELALPETLHHWSSSWLRWLGQSVSGQSIVIWKESEETSVKKANRFWLLLGLIPLLLLVAMFFCALRPATCPQQLMTATSSAGEMVITAANRTAEAWSKGAVLLQQAASSLGSSAADLSGNINWLLTEKLGLGTHYLSRPFGLVSYVGQSLYGLSSVLTSYLWSGLKSLPTRGWDTLHMLWSGLSTVVSAACSAVSSFLAGAWYGVESMASGVWSFLGRLTSGSWHSIDSLSSGAVNWVTQSVHAVSESSTWLLTSLWSWISLVHSSINYTVKLIAHQAYTLVEGLWNQTASTAGWAGREALYPVSLSVSGLRRTFSSFYSWAVSMPSLFSRVLLTAWSWPTSFAHVMTEGFGCFTDHLASSWAWLTSWFVDIPDPYQLTGSLLSIPTYILHLISDGWDRTKGFVYRPSKPALSTDIDLDGLVDKIIANQRFQEALSAMVQKNQASHHESMVLVSQYSHLDSDLNAKLEAGLRNAREELSGLVKALSEEQALDIQRLAEAQVEKEKRLEELLASLQNQETLLREKMDKLVGIQAEASTAAGHITDTLRLEIESLKDHVTLLETEVAELMAGLPGCCKHSADIEASVASAMTGLLSGGDTANPQLSDSLVAWMGRLFVSRSELSDKLQAVKTEAAGQINLEKLTALISDRIRIEVAQNASQQAAAANGNAMTRDEVLRIIQAALVQYDADKTGLFDYALETAGGSVVSTRCTETYVQKTALYSIFGIPVWYPSNNPRTIIQPGVQPGQCWAFKGSAGFVVIQLSEPVQPTRFSLEHIAQSMSPSGRIDSAPKDFVVLGLRTEKDPSPVRLGSYTYSQEDGRLPLQFFPVEQPTEEYFPFIELDINSNHGNVNYTCLYRFRVHGNPRPSS